MTVGCVSTYLIYTFLSMYHGIKERKIEKKKKIKGTRMKELLRLLLTGLTKRKMKKTKEEKAHNVIHSKLM